MSREGHIRTYQGLNGAVRPQRTKTGCSSEITGQGKNRKVKEAEALMQVLMSIEERVRVHSKRVGAYGMLENAARLAVDAHVDNTNVISAGDNQGGKSLQLSRAVRRLWETVSQRSGCPASRLTKASDVMLHRKVFQWIDAELGGVSGFDTDLMVSPSSVQSARDGRNLRFLSPYPTPYFEEPYNSPSKFCDATEGEDGVGGTGQVPQVLLVANCGKGAGSMCGLTSAILTEEKWWLAGLFIWVSDRGRNPKRTADRNKLNSQTRAVQSTIFPYNSQGGEFTSTPGCSGFSGVPRLWLPVVKRTLDTVAPVDIVMFFIWKDQKGKTKVQEAVVGPARRSINARVG
ncbi:hypothetical protein Bbelb_347850 [Branchiostoma belcheri]|nr:hypothetical protein Bbelb_347850 [Branchiostoma belcheri]